MRRLWGPWMVIAIASGACAFDGGADPGDDTAADADPGDDTADPDADDDGIPDTEDNCVDDANADQGDEDDDDVGDACDVCPTVADQHADGDGDEVGDMCDPNPGTAGDELLMFDGFHGGALGDGWIQRDEGGAGDPTWTVNADALIAEAGEAGTAMIRRVGAPGDRLVVEVAAYAETIGPGSQRSFGVISDGDDDPLAYDFCGVSFSNQTAELWRFEDDNWMFIDDAFLNAGIGAYRFRSRTTVGTVCTINTQSLPPEAVAGTGDHVGFRVRGATVRISYIAVYRSP